MSSGSGPGFPVAFSNCMLSGMVYMDLFPPVPGEVSGPHIIPALEPII